MTNPEKAVSDADGITAKVIDGLIAPVYQDLAQPSVKEVGKTIGGVIRTALLPVNTLVWSVDKVKDWILSAVEERLKHISSDKIIPPNPAIAGPAIEAIKFLDQEKELRNLYANLIASSMVRDVSESAHPGFIEVIRNLSSEDAVVLKTCFTEKFCTLSVQRPDRRKRINESNHIFLWPKGHDPFIEEITSVSISNLIRLGLVEKELVGTLLGEAVRVRISSENISRRFEYTIRDFAGVFEEHIVHVTEFGEAFCYACV
jgi:hypothetical protein